MYVLAYTHTYKIAAGNCDRTAHICVFTYKYTYKHICTYIHTHTYKHMCACKMNNENTINANALTKHAKGRIAHNQQQQREGETNGKRNEE